ncbi:hypothetical protein PTI98_010103 [Pleurotus ostreatus]|nr:hypothetical protein PTI98_010103 [Pleurotus ostreatus]
MSPRFDGFPGHPWMTLAHLFLNTAKIHPFIHRSVHLSHSVTSPGSIACVIVSLAHTYRRRGPSPTNINTNTNTNERTILCACVAFRTFNSSSTPRVICCTLPAGSPFPH